MRQISVLLVVALTVTTTFAYPASYEKDKESDTSEDAEFIVVPLSAQRPTYYNRYPSSFEGFDGVIDTGDFAPVPARPVYFPSYNPFSWHLSGYLDDILKRMRDRFAGSWNPFYSGIPSTVDFVPSGPGIWPSEIPDDSSSEDGTNTNSTSTVKVIDGHKVVINDTYYTKKTEYGTSIFKVRVIDVKPASGEGDAEETPGAPKPEQPTEEVETGNRNGEDDETESKKPESTTVDPTTRDTELESSDEGGETSADDNLNTIDSGSDDGDIDGPKAKEAAPEESDKTESSEQQWAGLESFEAGPANPPMDRLNDSPELALQRNRANSELLDSSSEEEDATDSDTVKAAREPLSDEWPQEDDRKRIIVSVNRFDNRFAANQQTQDTGAGAQEQFDLSNDIAINYRLAADKTVTINPNAITFNPMSPPPVIVQRDPLPSSAGEGAVPGFPPQAGGGRPPSMGFPPTGQAGFPAMVPFPGFPGAFPGGGQFPVQPFPPQTPLFGFPALGGPGIRPNFGVPANPQVPPFFFGNGPFGRP
ncbi:WW domain-binding protein 11 [Anopheles aquasalis]|uniref:WW domain-binding protein 11 n=1 Tax=Anopheles aquasalis TaxID=42839 RepID=UPI00215ABE56|nr:WW domain-binding protein 11 [Anopheles aquasalis]